MMPRLYLAGPDVFHPKRLEIFADRIAICRRWGFEALVPLDSEAEGATEIFQANVGLVERCDAVIANITPFRGPHCDVGTAWEIGYAVARSKPVFAFSAAAVPLASRIAAGAADCLDIDGMYIEDFGLSENLMVVEGLADRVVHSSFHAAVETAAAFHKTLPQHDNRF